MNSVDKPLALVLADECLRQSEEGSYERSLFRRSGNELRRLHDALAASEASDAESIRMYRAARDERDALAAANADFAARQAWWNDRMYALEQERDALAADVERERASRKQAQEQLQDTQIQRNRARLDVQREMSKEMDKLREEIERQKNNAACAVEMAAQYGAGLDLLRAEVERLRGAVRDEPPEVPDDDTESHWRRLALQFDRHRMHALSHLRMMIKDPAAHAAVAQEFLAAPPPAADYPPHAAPKAPTEA